MCLLQHCKTESVEELLQALKWDQKPYLDVDEEQELVKFVTNCAKMGYGKTRQDVIKIVEKYMVNNA